MKGLRVLLLGVLFALPMSLQAQEPAKPAPAAAAAEAPKAAPAADSSLDTNKDKKVDAAETAAATDADASVSDVVADGVELAKAAKDLADKPADMPVGTFLLILLGTIFKFLLSLMKVLGKNIPWFKSKDGKRVMKYSTLGLGAAAAVVANLAFGMPWMEAAQLILSGPIAVAIHEYTKDSKEPAPEAAKADA